MFGTFASGAFELSLLMLAKVEPAGEAERLRGLTCDRQVHFLVVGFFPRLDQTLVGAGVADPEPGDLVG